MFIFTKLVDRSSLSEGFTIPVKYHDALHACAGGPIQFGETRCIKIILEGTPYDAYLKNQGFNKAKYSTHPDVIQLRYSTKSPISKKLRSIFCSTWTYVNEMKDTAELRNRKCTIKIPEDMRELLVVVAADIPDTFIFYCLPKSASNHSDMEHLERILQIDAKLNDLALQVSDIKKKPQVVQIVTDSISVNSPTPHYVADETKAVVKEEVDVVTPPAKQQEVVAEQPVKQEKVKEEEIDYTTHAFAIHVTNPDKIQEVMTMLHRKMKKGGSLKQWMMPYRAAIEAGVISRTIKCKDFVDEFGEISSTTYSNYANRNGFYTAEQLDELVELFMRVGGFDH